MSSGELCRSLEDEETIFRDCPTTRADLLQTARSYAEAAFQMHHCGVNANTFKAFVAMCEKSLSCLKVLDPLPRSRESKMLVRLCLMACNVSLEWGKGDSMLALADTGLAIEKNNSELWRCKGEALACRGQYEAARPFFLKWMELKPQDRAIARTRLLELRQKQRQQANSTVFASASAAPTESPSPQRPPFHSGARSRPWDDGEAWDPPLEAPHREGVGEPLEARGELPARGGVEDENLHAAESDSSWQQRSWGEWQGWQGWQEHVGWDVGQWKPEQTSAQADRSLAWWGVRPDADQLAQEEPPEVERPEPDLGEQLQQPEVARPLLAVTLAEMDQTAPRDSWTDCRGWTLQKKNLEGARPSLTSTESGHLTVASSHHDFFVSDEARCATSEEATGCAEAGLERRLFAHGVSLQEQLPKPTPSSRSVKGADRLLREARAAGLANDAHSRGSKDLVVIEIEYQMHHHNPAAAPSEPRKEASFGMVLPRLAPGAISEQSLSFTLRSDGTSDRSLRGSIRFVRSAERWPLPDETVWSDILHYSRCWKMEEDELDEAAALLLGQTEEIVLVRLTKEGQLDPLRDKGGLDARKMPMDIFANKDPQTVSLIEDDLLDNFELESLVGGVSPYFVRSAVAEWLRRHPRTLQTPAAFAVVRLLGETVLDFLSALYEFLLPDAVWATSPTRTRGNGCMAHHAELRTAIRRRLLSCGEDAVAEAARAMMTRGLHLAEAFGGAWADEMTAGCAHVVAGGPVDYTGRTPSYTQFFRASANLFVKYDKPGWLCYSRDRGAATGRCRFRMWEQTLKASELPETSPFLEQPNRWEARQEVLFNARRHVYESPTLLELAKTDPSIDTALPTKIVKYLRGKPVGSLQTLKHNGEKTSPCIFLQESLEQNELRVGYGRAPGRVEWFKYRHSRDGLCPGFEWGSDDPCMEACDDWVSLFKKELDPSKRDDELRLERRWAKLTKGWISAAGRRGGSGVVDAIDQSHFVCKLREMGIDRKRDHELWFRLSGPDGTELRKQDLKGRWLEVRYSERLKTLLSGRHSGNLCLAPKTVEFLKHRHLASLVVPKPAAVGVGAGVALTACRQGFRCVLLGDGGPLVYSDAAKTWVSLPEGTEATELADLLQTQDPTSGTSECPGGGAAGEQKLCGKKSGDFQTKAQQILLVDKRPVAEAFRSTWASQPWIAPAAHVQGAVPREIDLPKLEERLGHKFSNPMILVEGNTHSSYDKAITPSQRRLAILGHALIRYFVTEQLLARNGLPTPESADLKEDEDEEVSLPGREDEAWLRLGNLRCTLEVATCAASLSRAATRLNLHQQMLFTCSGLGEALSQVPSLDEQEPKAAWKRFVARDAPKCLSESFEASVAAVLLDATWNAAYKPLSKLVMQDVLEALLRTPFFPLRRSPSTWGADAADQDLILVAAAPELLRGHLEEAAARSVISFGPGAADEAILAYKRGATDDLRFFWSEADEAHGASLQASGSCKWTALVRGSLPDLPAALAASQEVGAAEGQVEPDDFCSYCIPCKVACNSREQWCDHRNGQKHRKIMVHFPFWQPALKAEVKDEKQELELPCILPAPPLGRSVSKQRGQRGQARGSKGACASVSAVASATRGAVAASVLGPGGLWRPASPEEAAGGCRPGGFCHAAGNLASSSFYPSLNMPPGVEPWISTGDGQCSWGAASGGTPLCFWQPYGASTWHTAGHAPERPSEKSAHDETD